MSDASNPAGSQSLGIGSIISESFSLSLRNFLQLLLIMIVPFLVVGLVAYLLFGSLLTTMMTDPVAMQNSINADPTGFMIRYAVFLLISMLAYSFLYAACITAVFDARTGRGISIGRAISSGISRAVQLFVSMLVLGIILGIAMVVISLVLGLVMGLLGQAGGILAMIVMLVLMLWVMGLLLPFPAAVVVENLWLGAIGRAMQLSKGYRWWLVLMMFVFFLAVIVVELILGVLLYVLGQLGLIGLIILFVIGLVVAVTLAGASIALLTLSYARLREIKEGASVDSLAQVFD